LPLNSFRSRERQMPILKEYASLIAAIGSMKRIGRPRRGCPWYELMLSTR
jgi:hypothetical protein